MPIRRSTSRRAGLARLHRGLDVGAAAGQAGAEFVEDQAEALRVGQFVDVVDQVGVDAGAVVLQRQQVLAGAGLAGGDPASAAAPRASRERGAASAGSRRTSRRSATAGGSGSWRRCGSPGSRGRSIFITITALPGLDCGLAVFVAVDFARQGDADRLDFADVGAGDADLLALDHEAAVVEDRPHDVAVAAAAAAGDEQDDDDDRRRDERADDERLRLMGRVARRPGCTGTWSRRSR